MAIDGFILTQAIVSRVPLAGPAQRKQVESLLVRETDWLEHKAAFHLLPADDNPPGRALYRWILCSHIIALANTHGGALVVGVLDETAEIVGCLSANDPARADRVRELSNSLLTTLMSGKIQLAAGGADRKEGNWIVEGQMPLVEVNPLEVATPVGSKWLAVLAVQRAPEPILVRFQPAKGSVEEPVGLFRKPGNVGELEKVAPGVIEKRRDDLRRARTKFDEQYARLREQPDWRIVRGICRDALRPLPTKLLGRDTLLSTLNAKLKQSKPDNRILGLVGRAGIGKSALARAAASELLASFRGRVALIDVSAAVTISDLAAIVRAQLLPERAGGDDETGSPAATGDIAEELLSGVASLFVSSPALLVLDGCNKLDRSATEFVSRFAAELPRLRLVYTCDHPLDIDDAETLVVGPLSHDANPAEVGSATQLFLDSCAQSGIALDLTPPSFKLIEKVVTATGGNPLAIKATASLLKGRPLEILAAEASAPAISAGSIEATGNVLASTLQSSISALTSDSRRLLNALVFWGATFTRENALYMAAALKLANPEGAIGELRGRQFLEAWSGANETTSIPSEVYRFVRKQIDVRAKDAETAIAALLSYVSRGSGTRLPPETLQYVGLGAVGGAATLLVLSATGISLGGATVGGIATAVAGAAMASPLLPIAAIAAGAGYLWHRKRKKRAALEARFVQESAIVCRSATAMLEQGQPQQAIRLLEQTLKFATESELVELTEPLRFLLGRANCEAGNYPTGAAVLLRVLTERRKRNGANIIGPLKWLTIAFAHVGNFIEASRVSAEWAKLAETESSSQLMDASYWDGRASLGLGDHERARTSLQRAAALAGKDADAAARLRILQLLASAQKLAGELDAAHSTANTIVGLADSHGSVSARFEALLFLAEILEAIGQLKAARGACVEAAKALKGLPAGEFRRNAEAAALAIQSRLGQ